MAECNFSLPPIKDERLCKFPYTSWCPTCDRESTRRRTKSETNEICRRKGKEMKTFTPKKHSRCYDYENYETHYKYDRCINLSQSCCQTFDWPRCHRYETCQVYDDCQGFDTCARYETSCQKSRRTRANPFAEPNAEPFELRTTYIDGRHQLFDDSNMSGHKRWGSPGGVSDRPPPPSPPTRTPPVASIYMNAKSIANGLKDPKSPTSRPETCTFFDKKDYDVNAIRERYHREVEALRAKLKEIQKTRLLAAQLKKQYCDKEIIEVNHLETAEKNTVEIVKPLKYEMKPKPVSVESPVVIPKPRKLVRRIKSDKLRAEKSKMVLKTRSKLNGVKLRHSKVKVVKEEVCESSSSSSDDESVKIDENNMRIEEEVIEVDKKKSAIVNSSISIPRTISSDGGGWPLRDSLFPNVPPYINFSKYDAEEPFSVPAGRRVLKWKLSTITPVLIRKTLTNTGFVLVRSEFSRESNDWLGCWGKHMKSPQFQTLKDTQKLNHFPGTFQIGRKDRLWKNLQRLMFIHGFKEFDFMPQSYVIPQDLKILKQCWENKSGTGNEIFIIKPPASARGTGIKVINRWSQLPKKQSLVVQRYISNPYLINGSKFDLRLYVLVTSFNPLRIYLYPDGLARFASAKYSDKIEDLNDRYMHLTNYSINKLSSQYTANEDAFACQGHKWTLSKLWEFMEKDGVDTKALWKKMEDLVIKTMICGESPITQLTNENVNSRYNCYELFGVDILLDEQLKCWLLEVNISPSLHSASPLDAHVKGPMVKALLDLAQFHLPPKVNRTPESNIPCYEPKLYTVSLTKRESHKHNYFVQCESRVDYIKTILESLTGDDVRHLLLAEDELTVRGDFERIFPTSSTHHYFKYMEPRYYNRLFDAWEYRYESRRTKGIAILKKLCADKVHLKVGSQGNITKDLQNTISVTPTTLNHKPSLVKIASEIVTSTLGTS